MLGEKVSESTGKVTSRRVLPNSGSGPKVETSFEASGTLLGVAHQEWGTYWSELRADGTLYGEGQGVIMSKEGDIGAWKGSGVGTHTSDGGVRYRGAIYMQTTSPKWARLNSVAIIFEHDIDAQGNSRSNLSEWK